MAPATDASIDFRFTLLRACGLAACLTLSGTAALAGPAATVGEAFIDHNGKSIVLKAGHASLREWLLPAVPPAPADNRPNGARTALGGMLFFDPRLSRDGNMSCASCHNPMFGWSDALPTARGSESRQLARATPTIVNAAYNRIQMWDGRKKSLEDQATGPMEASVEMNSDFDKMLGFLRSSEGYVRAFAKAYPGEPIDKPTISKAIASFERTVVSRDTPFDRWVRGDAKALTANQVRGFRVFADPKKGNCAVCHSAPNFTDDGFHNVGLKSFSAGNPDLGRFEQRKVALMKGAFKTPPLREIGQTAPYFHDGSAGTLRDVIDHYVRGGEVKDNLAPNLRPLDLSDAERNDLLAFMQALNSTAKPVTLPKLPN